MSKIGLLTVGYGKTTWADQVFEPWFGRENLVISAAHGRFSKFISEEDSEMKDWFETNLKNKSNTYLKIVEDGNMTEAELRNVALSPLLDEGVDWIFLLDARDEIYTSDQISQIIKFIEKKTDINWFKIQFKNYIIFEGKMSFYYGFNPARVWNNRLSGGVKGFYSDNDVEFNNSAKQLILSNLTVPNDPVIHYSWVGSESELKEKINYQQSRWSHCSYKWSPKGLTFDPAYHDKYKIFPPKIYIE